jgi:3-oxoisoapionate decarboxylase
MSPPALGVVASSLADEVLEPAEALALAEKAGATHCLFGSVLDLSADLDAGRIADLCALGRDRNVTVEVGCVSLHPYRISYHPRIIRLGDGDALVGLRRLFAASREVSSELLFFVGQMEDRFNPLHPWPEQVSAAAALVSRLAPVLRDLDLRLVVKTHEEISSFEVMRLVDAVGVDVLGVALDPVNALVTAEDPVLAAERTAGAVSMLVVDDAELHVVDDVAHRLLCPLGSGVVDWPGVLAALDLPADSGCSVWLEMHRGQFNLRLSDDDWLTSHPDLEAAERHAVTALAASSTDRLDSDRVAALHAGQARPVSRLADAFVHAQALFA